MFVESFLDIPMLHYFGVADRGGKYESIELFGHIVFVPPLERVAVF